MNLVKTVKLRVALALSGLVLAGATSAVVAAAANAGPPPSQPCDVTTDYDACTASSDGGTGNGALPTVTPSPEPVE